MQRSRPRFNPWIRKIPWRRKWKPIPVLLPGEFHGQRKLVGYTPRLYVTLIIYLFIYAEYITQNYGLDEAQAGIRIAGRNINNLRYADDTILMAESKEDESERGE